MTTCFFLSLPTKKDKQRVLDGSPWSFQKNLLAFTDYDGNLRTSEYEFKRACFLDSGLWSAFEFDESGSCIPFGQQVGNYAEV